MTLVEKSAESVEPHTITSVSSHPSRTAYACGSRGTTAEEYEMKRVEVVIETGNAAFENDSNGEAGEVYTILRNAAEIVLAKGLRSTPLRDSNGNTVGSIFVS